MRSRKIKTKEIFFVLQNFKIIETYFEDKPFPSFLILGYTADRRPLHYEKGQILIIKNIPCLVCENCGEIYLTNETILGIEEFWDTTELPEIEVINYEKLLHSERQKTKRARKWQWGRLLA